MMKPSLQLRIGQQLTMTPQLQQAIRLLQLPALELQAQIRQALESNVMLEADEEFEPVVSLDEPERRTDTDEADPEEPVVEIGDEWGEPNAAESESPWSHSGEGPAEFADRRARRCKSTWAGNSRWRTCRPRP